MRSSGLILLTMAVALSAHAADLKPGQAVGTFMSDNMTVLLTHAVTFVDESDERKPVVLILSDKELPTTGWNDGSDFMMYRMKHPVLGVSFWLDAKTHEVFRTDYYDSSGFPSSASGVFELKLDPGDATSLAGSANSTAAAASLHDPVALDVKFSAALR